MKAFDYIARWFFRSRLAPAAVLLTIVGFGAILVGCSSTGSYNSSRKYERSIIKSKLTTSSMNYEGMARNPVIVIHGFLGSRLGNVRSGEDIWGTFKGPNLFESLSDEQMRQFSHPMTRGKPLRDLHNDTISVGLLSKVKINLMGVTFYLDAYDNLIEILQKAGYQLEGTPLPENRHFYSLFVFYYDWRRDLQENAARLHKFIMEKRAYLQREYEKQYDVPNFDVQFDIVAHSMGGLVARYYLMYGDQDLPEDGTLPTLDWSGSSYIDKLIVLGSPNAGYLDACLEMVDGLQLAPGAPFYPPALVGTFPAYYQMLPLTDTRSVLYADDPDGPPVDLLDPEVWIAMKWGLADPDQDDVLQILLPDVKTKVERRLIALEHLEKCLKRARVFTTAMRQRGTPPDDVAMFLFLGDAIPTRRTAIVDRGSGTLEVTNYEPGDGKVLSSSARFDEREGRKWTPFQNSPIPWQSVIHLNSAHMGITNSSDFANNVNYLLLTFPTRKQAADRKALEKLIR